MDNLSTDQNVQNVLPEVRCWHGASGGFRKTFRETIGGTFRTDWTQPRIGNTLKSTKVHDSGTFGSVPHREILSETLRNGVLLRFTVWQQ